MSSFFSWFDPGLFVVNPTLFSGMASDPVMPDLINHDQPFTIWAAMPNDPALPPPSSSTDDHHHNLSSSLLPVLIYEPLNCPDEILQEILSRVPAKHLVRLRTVCRRWKDLTSRRYFLNLHLKHCLSNSFAEILVEKQGPNFRNGKEFYSIDRWREVLDTPTRRSSIQEFLQKGCLSCQESDYNAYAPGNKSTRLFMSFSSFGFVVLHDEKICEDPPSSSCCVIVNPLTREKVKLIIANDHAALCGKVYGLFFHPVLEQICVLWGQQAPWNSVTFEFKLLNLGSQSQSPFQSCWRNIVPRLHGHRPRSQFRGIVPPVILDNVLYWMVDNIEDDTDGENDDNADEEAVKSRLQTYCKEAILAFDITKEEFDLLPHPGPCCEGSDKTVIKNHQWMQLLQTNNSHLLSLCEFLTSEKLINIWVRQSSSEEDGGAIWSIMHTVDNSQFCSIPPESDYCFRAIGMVDKELLLVQWVGFGLCVHNLKLGTVQLFETKSGMESIQHFSAAFVCAHSPSLLSMTNSKRAETVVEVPTSIRRLKRRGDVIY